MHKRYLFGTVALLLALSLNAADQTPKDEITAAIKALADKPNYSWKMTTVVPESSPYRPGPWDGKVEKEGFAQVTLSFGDNTGQFVLKGDKAAVSTQDGGWQSLADLDNSEGPGRFYAMIIRNFKAPTAQATQLLGFAKELKKDGETWVSDLTEEGAKELLTWRPRGGGDGPSVSNAKGSVKFWLKEGLITKYEFKLKGTVSFNGNEFENDRATTIEIKDVGTTKLSVPEEAKKKLS